MAQLLFKNQTYALKKTLVTVGSEPQYDLFISTDATAASQTLLFSLIRRPDLNGRYEIHPSRAKIRINGQATTRPTLLSSCDRIEWSDGAAVYTEAQMPLDQPVQESQALQALQILNQLASTLHGNSSLPVALEQTLRYLVEMAGSESGHLLTEIGENGSWELVASVEQQRTSRSQLFSNTILQEAIAKKSPVYVESIVGHPWADAQSVVLSKIFSAACLPLCVEGRVIGAVFLFTQTPGRSIKKETLNVLNLLATQAALMLASQVEIRRSKKVKPSETAFILDRDRSSQMLELEKKISKLAPTPLSVLIQGETGTGKEKVARELHRQSLKPGSGKTAAPFIAVNCAAIPGSLLESTLFGFEKGSFTGAVKSQPGKFLQASGGTLFLDEIGDLSMDLQAKLLRVLQEKQVEPIGSLHPIPIEIRLISATHQDLEKKVKEGTFRQDLYFRLCGAILKLPPLRERTSDILLLAEHFLQQSGKGVGFSKSAQEALISYAWPGNIRELEQVVSRAALLTDNPEILPEDLELNLQFQVESNISELNDILLPLDQAQMSFTYEYVRKALEKNDGNRSTTAQSLGISERTLYRILSTQKG